MKKKVDNFELAICRKLKTLRLQKGIKIKDLVHNLGVSYQQFSKYENGKNRISTGSLANLTKLLGVSIDYFYDEPKIRLGKVQIHKQKLCEELSINFIRVAKLEQCELIVDLVKSFIELQNKKYLKLIP